MNYCPFFPLPDAPPESKSRIPLRYLVHSPSYPHPDGYGPRHRACDHSSQPEPHEVRNTRSTIESVLSPDCPP